MATQQTFSPFNAFLQGRQARLQEEYGNTRNALAKMELDNAPAQMQRQNRLADIQLGSAEQTQQIENTRMLNAAMAEISQNPAAAERWVPQLQQRGVISPTMDWRTQPPEVLQENARKVFESTSQALRAYSQSTSQNSLVQSTFQGQNGNAWYMTRDGKAVDTGVPMQKFSPQVIERAGGLDVYDPNQRGVIGGLSSPAQERNAAASEAAAVQGAKDAAAADVDLQKKQIENSKAYDAFKIGMTSLEQAMSQTRTDPITGLLPPITAAAQTAQGAQATMAPILKQLFRSAGEGTFTDKDQELLLDMVPTRKDHPEARKAKIQMVDSIVRAKLGIASAFAPAPGQSDGTDPRIQSLLDKYAPQQ